MAYLHWWWWQKTYLKLHLSNSKCRIFNDCNILSFALISLKVYLYWRLEPTCNCFFWSQNVEFWMIAINWWVSSSLTLSVIHTGNYKNLHAISSFNVEFLIIAMQWMHWVLNSLTLRCIYTVNCKPHLWLHLLKLKCWIFNDHKAFIILHSFNLRLIFTHDSKTACYNIVEYELQLFYILTKNRTISICKMY
jgi:hypothetical protein